MRLSYLVDGPWCGGRPGTAMIPVKAGIDRSFRNDGRLAGAPIKIA